MKLPFFVLLFFTVNLLSAQVRNISILVLDKDTKQAINNVHIFKSCKGVEQPIGHTNAKGRLSVEQLEWAASCELLTSALSYYPISVLLSGQSVDTLFLEFRPYDLPEVAVGDLSIYRVGISEKRRMLSVGFGSPFARHPESGYYFQYGVAFKNIKYGGRLSSVTVKLKKKTKQKGSLRVRFYDLDENGDPGKEINKQSILIELEKKDKQGQVNLEGLDLWVSKNGFCISLESFELENYDWRRNTVRLGLYKKTLDEMEDFNIYWRSNFKKWKKLQGEFSSYIPTVYVDILPFEELSR